MVRHGLVAFVGCVLVVGVGAVLVATVYAQPVTSTTSVYIDPATRPTITRFLAADTVLVGKIASIEAEAVELSGGVKYSIANVKVEDGFIGTKNTTHVKVGFIANPRGGDLVAGGQYLLFLTKHPTEGFQVMPPMALPISAKNEAAYKKAVAEVEKAAVAVKDPVAALKTDKAADRGFAAVVLLTKYRTPPPGVVRQLENEDLTAEESKLLLAGLNDADWATDANGVSGFTAFRGLALSQRDGWTQPGVKQGANVIDEYKKAYTAWLGGAGKEYRVKKLALKGK